MTGWGWRTYPRGVTSDTLQKISMFVIPNSKYDRDYPHMVNDNHICAFKEDKVGICLVSYRKILKVANTGKTSNYFLILFAYNYMF
jgi:hypothetical protein